MNCLNDVAIALRQIRLESQLSKQNFLFLMDRVRQEVAEAVLISPSTEVLDLGSFRTGYLFDWWCSRREKLSDIGRIQTIIEKMIELAWQEASLQRSAAGRARRGFTAFDKRRLLKKGVVKVSSHKEHGRICGTWTFSGAEEAGVINVTFALPPSSDIRQYSFTEFVGNFYHAIDKWWQGNVITGFVVVYGGSEFSFSNELDNESEWSSYCTIVPRGPLVHTIKALFDDSYEPEE